MSIPGDISLLGAAPTLVAAGRFAHDDAGLARMSELVASTAVPIVGRVRLPKSAGDWGAHSRSSTE